MSDAVPLFEGKAPPKGTRLGIVRSLWHGDLTRAIADDAKRSLVSAGVSADDIVIVDVPGSFEIPLACQTLIDAGVRGLIAVGVILRGETAHADLIGQSVTQSLMEMQVRSRTPIIHEVLLVASMEQAHNRATGPRAVGAHAAASLLKSLAVLSEMRRGCS